MRNYYFVLIFIFSFICFATENKKNIQVSPTFKISLPYNIKTNVDLPNLETKFLKINSNNKFQDVYIIHNNPSTYASKESVNRYWNQSRKQNSKVDINEKDNGCKRIDSRNYQCSRQVKQAGKYINELLHWNSKNDLVLVRVTSDTSYAHSRDVLSKIKITTTSNLFAGYKNEE